MMTVGVSSVAISFRLTYYFLQNEWSIHALRFSQNILINTQKVVLLLLLLLLLFSFCLI